VTVYTWEGKNPQGRLVRGELDARDMQAVFNMLRSQKIVPIANKIKEKGRGLEMEIKLPTIGSGVSAKEIVLFTRQFATMIDSGLPMVQALDVLTKQADRPIFQKILKAIKEDVERGSTLSEAMAKHPKQFDNLYTNMIHAGEQGGMLDIILERLSQHMEKAMKLKREIKAAMIYPAVVVTAAILVTSILLIFVIPTFADLFSSFGAALPLPTQIVINLSLFFTTWWYLIFGTLGTSVWMFLRFLKTERGKEVLHPLALKLPIFGNIIKKVSVARFTRTLGTMVSSGVPIMDALTICAKTSGNKVVERDVLRARIAISEGKTMVEPLETSSVFPPMVVQMIGVGEQTGCLDAMLAKVADFYEEEVDTAVASMKQLIEPIMILVLGTIIGALVIAMYLPIFKMGSVVG
jgi:type IV pilus assembly protein PilC